MYAEKQITIAIKQSGYISKCIFDIHIIILI